MKGLVRQKIVDALAAPLPQFTRRTVRLPAVPGKAVAVIGPRRAGKTTLLWQVLADRFESGTPREGLLYFNFEDERLAEMTVTQLQWVVEEYYALTPEWRDRRRATFFLDEIQVVDGWERFVRRLLDSERVDIFVSGSSSRLLSREVATQMRGRAMEALVLPFSFRECLRHAGAEPDAPADRLTKSARSTVEKRLREYLTAGGYPEAQGLSLRDRWELLRGYVDTALFRDVVGRHGVTNPAALRWMVRHLLGNAAGTFSVQRFYRDLHSQGIPVAKDTLHNYLGHLEDAFLVRTLPIAAESERRRMVNPRKVYPVDPGLIPVFDRAGRANEGHALETAVALELERRGAELAYVRTQEGFEVDFLARYPDNVEQLIQVCADLDAPAACERELRGLRSAAIEHPRATAHLIALTVEGVRPPTDQVRLHRAADWLLQT
jgi:predicted AAA+ superfamily ATPase